MEHPLVQKKELQWIHFTDKNQNITQTLQERRACELTHQSRIDPSLLWGGHKSEKTYEYGKHVNYIFF